MQRVINGELNWKAFEELAKESPYFNYTTILFSLFRYHMSNIFIYEGLPDSIPEEVMEYILYEHGQGIFFKDVADAELSFLPFGSTESKNKYGIPVSVTATPINAQLRPTQQIMIDVEGIIIKAFNDLDSLSPRMMIQPLIYNMVKIMVKKYTNLLDSNIALVYEVESGQQKQVKKELKGIFNSDDSYVVIVNDGVNKNNLFNDIEIEYRQSDFWEDYHTCKSEVLNILGINSNDNVDKKERMNVPEVDANNEESNNILGSMLKAREKALKKINTLFSVNITVRVNKPVEEEKPPTDDKPELDDEGNPIVKDDE